MILEVKNTITGDFIASKSKSFAIRAAVAAFLANKEIRLRDYPKNSDSLAALQIIRQLGGMAVFYNNDVIIKGEGISFPEEIFCGESAFCLNVAIALALHSKKPITLTGEKTLLTRNLLHIFQNLTNNGIIFQTQGMRLPLTIYPNPSIDIFHIDGSRSSQLSSGILLSAIYYNNIKFKVRDLVSQTYFEMTQALMKDFGYQTIVEDGTFSLIKTSEPLEVYDIEGDWSGIANILAAAAISGEISVQGLNPESKQPDRVLIDIMSRAGANAGFSGKILRVRSSELRSFKHSIDDCPDLFPILCVLAAYANGKSIISGIRRLIHKETHRPYVMALELRKAGVDIRLDNMTAEIIGGKPKGADFSSHNDHRIAMALTIASLFASSQSTLSEPECVEKSYPDFFRDLGII